MRNSKFKMGNILQMIKTGLYKTANMVIKTKQLI